MLGGKVEHLSDDGGASNVGSRNLVVVGDEGEGGRGNGVGDHAQEDKRSVRSEKGKVVVDCEVFRVYSKKNR